MNTKQVKIQIPWRQNSSNQNSRAWQLGAAAPIQEISWEIALHPLERPVPTSRSTCSLVRPCPKQVRLSCGMNSQKGKPRKNFISSLTLTTVIYWRVCFRWVFQFLSFPLLKHDVQEPIRKVLKRDGFVSIHVITQELNRDDTKMTQNITKLHVSASFGNSLCISWDRTMSWQ